MIHTLTKTAKKSSELNSWTLFEAVFLSLQWDASLCTSSNERLNGGPQSVTAQI